MKSPIFWAKRKGDFIHNMCLISKKYYAEIREVKGDPRGRMVKGTGQQPIAYWDCGLEF